MGEEYGPVLKCAHGSGVLAIGGNLRSCYVTEVMWLLLPRPLCGADGQSAACARYSILQGSPAAENRLMLPGTVGEHGDAEEEMTVSLATGAEECQRRTVP